MSSGSSDLIANSKLGYLISSLGCDTCFISHFVIIDCVKDLIKSLRRENETCDIRRFLGLAQVLQEDLIPLITQYGLDDDELFEVTIRYSIHNCENLLNKSCWSDWSSSSLWNPSHDWNVVYNFGWWFILNGLQWYIGINSVCRCLMNLTQPARIVFKNEIPQEKTTRHSYMETESHLQSYKKVWEVYTLSVILTLPLK